MSKYIHNIRGVVNVEITNKFASHLGTMLGDYLGTGKNVVVARDLNIPSQMIKRSLTTGLMSAGVNVVDFGVAPIPVIHYSMGFFDASAMITVSKSHLRPEDIDIKIISEHEIPLEQIHAEKVPWNEIGQLRYVHEFKEQYINGLLEKVNTELIKNKAFLLVLDCEEGLDTPLVSQILEKLHAETVLIQSRDLKSDVDFPEPSPKRIALLSELTTALGADMGIVLDNDRDRAVFIDERGNIIREQTILNVFAKNALTNNPEGTIVSSIVASQSLDETVTREGGHIIKTSVDNILNEIDTNNAVFGGDEPGMYVFPEFQTCFDAIFAVVKMLEIVAQTDTTLYHLTSQIKEYNRTGFTIECEHEKKEDVIEVFKTKFESEKNIDTIDGVRVDLKDSFLLIRPSRFEPLIRVYIESKNALKLQELTESVKNIIENV